MNRARKRVGQHGLSHTRNIFNQRMTAREQAHDQSVHRLHIAHVHRNNVLAKGLDAFLHAGKCNALRSLAQARLDP